MKRLFLISFFFILIGIAKAQPIEFVDTNVVHVTCADDSTGSVQMIINDPSGTRGPYTYRILFASSYTTACTGAEDVTTTATSYTFPCLKGGTFVLTVQDKFGNPPNMTTGFWTITINTPATMNITANMTEPTCFGGSDGELDITISGGTAPYSNFLWSTGATTEDVTGLSAGTYSVTFDDANGCTYSEFFTVTEPTEVSFTLELTHITCFGDDDGIIDVTSTTGGDSGPPGYRYQLNGSGGFTGASTFTGLAPGFHNLSVRDGSNCQVDSLNIEILEPPALTLAGIVTDVSCNGGTDGAIDATPGGGAAPYTYSWAPGGTSGQDTTNVPANTYTLTVTDTNGCVIAQPFTVDEPTAINIAGVVTDVSCHNGTDGAIDITTSGGTGPYTWLWAPGGSTGEDTTGVDTGSYTINVLDFNNCPASQAFVVNQPDSMTISAVITDISCNGGNDGAIDVSVIDGTPPYATYLWTPGGTTGQDTSAIAAGTYRIDVTDNNGCSQFANFTVNEPDSISIAGVINNVSCFGGTDGAIDITPSGGTVPYTNYLWAPGGSTGEDTANVDAGSYTITVTDNNSCTNDATFIVTEPDSMTITGVVTDATCNGATDGTIDVTVIDGTPGYTYSWAPGGSTGQDTLTVGAGTYTITVTDNNFCVQTKDFTINEPSAINIAGVVTDVSCHNGTDGAIDITTSGGTGPYTWFWAPGGSTGEDTTGVDTGSYTINVLDFNNCPASQAFVVNQPDSMTISAVITDVSCNGGNDGAIDVSVIDGTPPYATYLWTPGGTTGQDTSAIPAGTYRIDVSDNNGCSQFANFIVNEPVPISIIGVVSNVSCFGGTDGAIDVTISNGTPPYSPSWAPGGSTSEDTTGLDAGLYTISVSDAGGCNASAPFNVTEPDSMTITGIVTDPSCNGGSDGSIDVTVIDGTPGYSYSWAPGGSTGQDTLTVGVGIYTITVTDNNSCVQTKDFVVNEPTDLSTSAVISSATCNGGSDGAIDLTVSGGTLPIISYSWNPGGQTTEDISGLVKGDYIVTVTDNNSCTEIDTFTVNENLPIIIADSITNVSCFGGSDGEINISITGGNPPYNPITWSHGPTTEDVSGLNADTFIVVVNDALACMSTDTFIVTEPAGMTIAGAITDVSCKDSTDGAIDITVSGGVTPYQSYLWSPGGATSEDTSGLPVGRYFVTVSDSNNCMATDSFDVAEPSYVTSTAVLTQPTCDGDTDGAIDITPAGGTAPYGPFNWNSGTFITEDISGLDSNRYIVVVTDFNGCTGTDTFDLTDPDPIVSTAVISLASCNGGADGAIDITTTGGTGPYVSYAWSPGGQTTEDISGLTAGQYIVTVTDSIGCVGIDTFDVAENTPIVIADSIDHILCNGDSTGTINVTVSGGVAPYASYDWNSGFASTEDLSGIPAGQYIFTVEDNVNCITIDTFIVTEPPAISIVDTITHVDCGGDSTGAINLTISGGVGGFTYLWTPGGSTGEDTSNVIAGSYDFTVTDTNGCSFMSTFVVNENTPLSTTSTTTTTCANDSTGAIDLTVNGGTAPFSFDWNSGAYTTEDLSNISGGVYTVEVTDSLGCVVNDTITVPVNPIPTGVFTSSTDTACYGETVTTTATLDNPPFFNHPSGSYSFDNGATFGIVNTYIFDANTVGDTTVIVMYRDAVGCISDPDTVFVHVLQEITATLDTLVFPTCTGPPGELRVHNIAGGISPYDVAFNGGTAVQTNDTTYTGLLPGLYTVDINDAHGCTFSESVNFLSSISATIDTTRPTCNGSCDGIIAISNVTGGIAPYEFSLNDTVADPFSPADSTFTGLCAGNYDVYIKDSTDCISVLNITLGEPNPLQVVELGIKDESCNGVGDGEISVRATGGNGDYTFTFNTNIVTGAGPHTFTNIPAGQDTVFLVDSAGCSDDHIFTITPSDSLITYLSEQLAASGCNMNDGIGVVDSVVGGSGSYQFSINGGVSYQDTTIFSSLLSGSYLVITRDKIFGCRDTTRFEISAPAGINMPPIVDDITDPSCVTNDGSINLTNITGGSTPYSFSLSGPNTAPSQADSTFNDLVEGFYFITITDGSGCDHDYYFFVGPATPLNMVATPTPENCINQDGTLTLNITGGRMPYLVNINDGASYNLDTLFSASSLFVSNLSSGTYNVTLSDSSNPSCTDLLSVTINSNRTDAILDEDTVSCPWSTDGDLAITLADNAFYSFSFSVDDTLSFDTSRSYSNLGPGVHQLWIKQYDLGTGDSCIYPDNESYYYVPWADSLLNVLYDSSSYPHMYDTSLYDTFTVANFIIFAPDSMNTQFTTTNSDKHQTNGTALIHGISGGTPGYEYAFGDTTTYTAYNSADTTQNIVLNLPPGDTLVYIRDSNMCVQPFVVSVNVNLFIPNIFTPNNDGDNDVFEVCGLTADAELSVYNRWGSRVYYKQVYDNTWGGEKLSDGTYFFEIKTVTGESYNGWVEILR